MNRIFQKTRIRRFLMWVVFSLIVTMIISVLPIAQRVPTHVKTSLLIAVSIYIVPLL